MLLLCTQKRRLNPNESEEEEEQVETSKASRSRASPKISMAATMMTPETHPWLKWPGCDNNQKIVLNNKLAEMQHRGICPPRFIAGRLCDQLNVTGRLKEMLRTKNETRWKELEIPVWERALNVKEQVFREWCLEFYCSLEVEKKKFTSLDFDNKKLISFRLGGKEHKVSVTEFGVLTGLFTQEEANHTHIGEYLLKGELNSKDFEANAAWASLTGLPKHTGTSKTSSIRIPFFRFVHKLLTHSFIQRSTQHDKVYLDDLWLLHTFYQGKPGKYVCVPWVLVCFMEARGAGRQKDSQMCCGHFITRIVKNLKLYTAASVRACSAPVDYKLITLHELETSKLVNRSRNGLVDNIAAEEEDVGSEEEEEGGENVPESSGRMRRGSQRQLLMEMRKMTKSMSEMGQGMHRIERKVDCAVADYSYHMGRYQPYLEEVAAERASASGVEWSTYAPPPPYAPSDQEEEEEGDEEEEE